MSRIPARMRQAVLERDNWTCRYCATQPDPLWEWHDGAKRWMCHIHIDHIIPHVQGGPTELDNLAAACSRCNLAKYDQYWVPLDWNA